MCSLTSGTGPGLGFGSARGPEVIKALAAERLPNIPLAYWGWRSGERESPAVLRSRSCAKIPKLWDLHFNNLYWQKAKTSNGTFYLYGAYLDRRKNLRERLSCYKTSKLRPGKLL